MSRAPILGDVFADQVVRRIDYDFGKLKTSDGDRYALAIRAKHLDEWTRAFITAHSEAVVLHLGCGLDSRVFRVDPPPGVRWFDLDSPDVIALRQQFYPEREGYTMIGASVTDLQWLDEVPGDRPVLVVAEGLLPYLTQRDIGALVTAIMDHFPSGELAFDVLNRVATRAGRYKRVLGATGASLCFAVDDPAEITRLDPRLVLMADTSIIGSPYVARMPRGVRLLCRVMNRFPTLRNLMRLLRYRFPR